MRTGKIAHLPNELREQLNRRLQNGEPGKAILKWLNSLPEVQTILKAQFKGHPVSPSNLTEWKQGGYLDWQVRQDALQLAASLRDESALGDKALTEQFTRKLAQWVAIQYAASAQALVAAETDPQIKWSRLRHLCADVCRLRRGYLLAERLEVEREWLALEKSNTEQEREKLFWAWTDRPDISAKLRPDQKRGLSEEALRLIDGYLMEGISPLDPKLALNAKTWGAYATRPPKGYEAELARAGTVAGETIPVQPPNPSPTQPAEPDQTPQVVTDATAKSPSPPLEERVGESRPRISEPAAQPPGKPQQSSESLGLQAPDFRGPVLGPSATGNRPSDLPAVEPCPNCGSPAPPLLPSGERPLEHCKSCGNYLPRRPF
jgi:hypothetical protein